jgi:hypothetical protein
MLLLAVSGLFDGLAHEPRRHGVRWCVSCPLDAPAGRMPPRAAAAGLTALIARPPDRWFLESGIRG